MKIGILATGHSPDEIRDEEGDYDDLFHAFLAGKELSFETYPVIDDIWPDSPDDADGWLITGSKHGVYEDHPWIPPLEDFIRGAYAASVPVVGICFGHQIVAQALGGKVEKFDGGWSVGATEYKLKDGQEARLIAWHQDQVIEPPADAEVEGSSAFCRYAVLRYGDKALTIQPHPEFTPKFSRALLEARGTTLPYDIAENAASSFDLPLDREAFSEQIADFFRASVNRLAVPADEER
ncbi:GMP synthase [glutamine-hydrolyzing] [Methyloligella halotolerans]|uniref:GMP synthase [glutamine-hydrolyzing] n=1 Tax=Methyloligella halotolerans TaxID=1177755 RepID=A0A1E2RXA0_9HYPH|nr:type 1 glutamine amidotransferase [Methyloligella halotolerans]ODA66745.1 GMP synthase [glutamine-hydrolyzing] [Methyloligella halotolerans]